MSEDTGKHWDDSLISMGLGALVVVVSGILLFNYFNNQAPKLLKDQAQKSVTVSSSMPVVSQNSAPTSASASATKAIAKAATAAPTATAVATATPKATIAPTPTPRATVAPSVSPKASTTPTARPEATAAATIATDTKTLPASYTVQPGDSLWAVSEKFYGTGYEWKQIASANKMTGSYRLEKGQVLTVPKVEMISATSTDKSQVAQATPVATTQPATSVSPAPAVGGATVAPQGTKPVSDAITYTVVHGDSLWSIAESKCNTGYAWTSIAKQNNLRKPSTIHAGNTFTFTCS